MATDVERLLSGRAIIGEYRSKLAKGIDESAKLQPQLETLGFPTVGDFFTFNDQLCLQALKAMKLYGSCDLCMGWKSKKNIPYCQQRFGDMSCAAKGIALTPETIYKAILYRLQLGDWGKDSWEMTIARFKEQAAKQGKTELWFCPQGHGYYIKPAELVPGQFPLSWR